MSNFSEKLKYLRGNRNKAEFARFLGIPAPMYHRYENGQVPKHDYLSVISQKTGKSIEWLLGKESLDASPVAHAAKEAREAGGADEERMIVSEITDRLKMMKTARKSGRDRLKKAITNRLDEYSDYCEDHYAHLRDEIKVLAIKMNESKNNTDQP